jgi:hypothetical protein
VRNQPNAKLRRSAAIRAVITAAATAGAAAGSVAGVASAGVAGVAVAAVAIDVYLLDSGARDAGGRGGMFRSLRGLLSGVMRQAAWSGVDPADVGLMASVGWRLMRVAACMMPTAAGRRWLAEAESFLAEAPPVLRRGAVGSYLVGAPRVIVVSWAACLARRAMGILRGSASR